jgi:hypothetical protein
MPVKWRKESNAKSAIGHRVQKAMRCGDQEKPQRHDQLFAGRSGSSHQLSCRQANR